MWVGGMKVRNEVIETNSSRVWFSETPSAAALARITRLIRSPSTGPGWIQLQRMPNGPTSRAVVRVSPTIAHFEAT